MPILRAAAESLAALPGVQLRRDAPLSDYTRFAIGGPAALLVESNDQNSFAEALGITTGSGLPWVVIGGGSNLVVSDLGFDGIVLRYTGRRIEPEADRIAVDAGAVLQNLVDASIEAGLEGLHTMTGIPGLVGGAVYGNAGAYGHSIHEFVASVRATDGKEIRNFPAAECEFRYRESFFKRNKQWIVLSADLRLVHGDRDALRKTADGIRAIRDEKYPPDMKCAGSIFKNLLMANLPEHARSLVPATVVRDGKVPSAWFLEQAGLKGLRVGFIKVAEYHANLIYNEGGGNTSDLITVIDECKRRVCEKFGFELEEEVQYIGAVRDHELRMA